MCEWAEWTSCTATCNGGMRYRTHCVHSEDCAEKEQSEPCNEMPCEENSTAAPTTAEPSTAEPTLSVTTAEPTMLVTTAEPTSPATTAEPTILVTLEPTSPASTAEPTDPPTEPPPPNTTEPTPPPTRVPHTPSPTPPPAPCPGVTLPETDERECPGPVYEAEVDPGECFHTGVSVEVDNETHIEDFFYDNVGMRDEFHYKLLDPANPDDDSAAVSLDSDLLTHKFAIGTAKVEVIGTDFAGNTHSCHRTVLICDTPDLRCGGSSLLGFRSFAAPTLVSDSPFFPAFFAPARGVEQM